METKIQSKKFYPEDGKFYPFVLNSMNAMVFMDEDLQWWVEDQFGKRRATVDIVLEATAIYGAELLRKHRLK